jgi:hypothetical protein
LIFSITVFGIRARFQSLSYIVLLYNLEGVIQWYTGPVTDLFSYAFDASPYVYTFDASPYVYFYV